MRPVFASRQFAVAILVAGILLPFTALGADLISPFTGDLRGRVLDKAGTPQMGASVQILNKYQRLIASTFTAPDGRFAIPDLPNDLYSVRVSLASFLPASRDKVSVKAGLESFLEIHLATLFSNIEVSYTAPTGAMSDDWKWVLRSSPATRPITRLFPEIPRTQKAGMRPNVFSETHAVLEFSGGDGGFIDGDQMGADLDTGFALSTNLFGKNQVQVAGTFGQNADLGPPAMAICAIYSRKDSGLFGLTPEVTLTVAQVGGINSQLGAFTQSGTESDIGSAAATLRTMTLSLYETADPLDTVHLEYGATGESVEYLQHINRVSPFARLTFDLGQGGSVIAAYSNGGRPDQLISHRPSSSSGDADGDIDTLSPALDTLSRLPQISSRDGNLKLQRTQSYELGYSKSAASRTYAASAFFEDVSNGRVSVAGDLNGLDSGDVLSYGFAATSTYNIGNYTRMGYFASVDQSLDNKANVAFAYGRTDGFTAGSLGSLSSGGKFLQEGGHNIASISIRTVIRKSGTRLAANYGWVDPRTLMPRHIFMTQDINVAPGFNIIVRQPLPSFFGMSGHFELTADMRNMLAGGYVPLDNGGHRLLLVDAPRTVRGGLKFTF